MNQPLELLAKELETLVEGDRLKESDETTQLIANIRDPKYPRHHLVADLEVSNLKFFARKLADGYYERVATSEE